MAPMNRLGPTTAVLAGGLLAVLATTTVLAVDIRGSMRIPEGYVVEAPSTGERPAYYWEEWNGFLAPRPPHVDARRELAVVLLGDGEPPAPINATVKLSGGSLLPSTVVLRAGQTIRIENTDEFTHQLVAEGLDGFSAEGTSSGQARTVNLARAGNWPLRDRILGHVRGHLHVLPNLLAVGQVDSEARFTFPGIPPGTYTLKVLHGAREVTSQEVTVADTRELVIEPIQLTAPAPARGTR